MEYTKTPSRIIIRGMVSEDDIKKIQRVLEAAYPGKTVRISTPKM